MYLIRNNSKVRNARSNLEYRSIRENCWTISFLVRRLSLKSLELGWTHFVFSFPQISFTEHLICWGTGSFGIAVFLVSLQKSYARIIFVLRRWKTITVKNNFSVWVNPLLLTHLQENRICYFLFLILHKWEATAEESIRETSERSKAMRTRTNATTLLTEWQGEA